MAELCGRKQVSQVSNMRNRAAIQFATKAEWRHHSKVRCGWLRLVNMRSFVA